MQIIRASPFLLFEESVLIAFSLKSLIQDLEGGRAKVM